MTLVADSGARTAGPEPGPASGGRRRRPVGRALRWVRRHRLAGVGLVLVVLLSPWEVSFGLAMTAAGSASLSARAAEWVRDHGGSAAVVWVENLWYSHHQPPKGGAPPRGAIPAPTTAPAAAPAAPAAAPAGPSEPAHLPPPAPVAPLASPALAGEGQWHPVGRRVGGLPAVYEAFLRPDAVHTSLVAAVAWMDTRLLRVALYSGSYVPGGGPWALTAPIGAQAANSVVAAFNSGFRLKDAQGGYYSEGRMVAPLRTGAASFVVYRDGTANVAQWGRDARMGPDVASVRQNIRLLVDGGAPVPGLASARAWGATVGNKAYVWRSGVGVTRGGALVYAAGPGLDVPSLASLLARAGAVRAMELDINYDWVNFTAYSPATPSGPATPGNGATLLAGMHGGTGRYFQPWWDRDFIVMSAIDGGESADARQR